MFPQSLLLSAPYLPSFPEAAFPDSLAHIPPKRKLLQGSAKAIGARCNIENGSLRQAAQACVQRLQAAQALPVSTLSAIKRPLPDSPSATPPSNLPPLAQRIRSDIKVADSEFESPQKEILRSSPSPENSPPPISPCAKHLPAPAPLVFTPVCQKVLSCLNCEAEMTADHQCDKGDPSVSSEDACSANTGQSSAQEITTDHTHDVHRLRRLNIVKFCDNCDTLHPSGGKCPTCENDGSPT